MESMFAWNAAAGLVMARDGLYRRLVRDKIGRLNEKKTGGLSLTIGANRLFEKSQDQGRSRR